MEWVSKYPLSDVRSDSDALNVDNDIVSKTPSHHEPDLSDQHGVVSKYPLSDIPTVSDPLNVDNYIVGETSSQHGPDHSDQHGLGT